MFRSFFHFSSLYCVILCCVASPHVLLAQQGQSVLLLDDFEGETAFPFNEFNAPIVPPFADTMGSDISMQAISDYYAFCQSGKSLQINYELAADSNGFCGFESRMPLIDLTDYHYLSFRVKGAEGLDMIQIELVHENEAKSKLSIWDFIPCGLNNEWKKVVIPLDNFWNLQQRNSIEKLVVIFDQNAAILSSSPLAGEVYFDDFLFGTFSPGYVKIDAFDDLLNTNATGGNNADFSQLIETPDDFWSQIECDQTSSCSCKLRLHYNTEENEFGGAFFILGGGQDGWTPVGRNVSDYDSLRLITYSPSSVANPGNYKIELKGDGVEQDVFQYRIQGISTSEQVFSIPFEAFTPSVDPSSIGEFTVVFERSWQFQPIGEVFIDEIELRAESAIIPDTIKPVAPTNVLIDNLPVIPMNTLPLNSTVSIAATIENTAPRFESIRLEYKLDCGWVCAKRIYSPIPTSEVNFFVETIELPQQSIMEMRMVVENYNGYESESTPFVVKVGEWEDNITAEQLLRNAYSLFEYLRHENGVYVDAANFAPDQFHPASVASTGMGLIALCIADSMGWIENAEELVLETLTSMNGLRPGFNPERNSCGWFRHFIDQETGAQAWDSEFSSIDSGILTAGALFSKKYFSENESIAQLANCLYLSTDWESMIADSETGGIYLVADENCNGDFQTLPFNEYMIVAWLAKNDYRQEGEAEALWNMHYEDPSELPTSNLMGVEVLTDSPGRFLSGFVHQFPFYLCHHYTTNSAYLEFFNNAMQSDSIWWANNTECYNFTWGFGAGSSCVWDDTSGYHADDLLEHPGVISSPHIIGGFIPTREEGLNDLLRLHNTPLGVYNLPDINNTPVLWRFSTEDPNWKACDIQSVDYSTLLFGGVAHSDMLGTMFFEYFNNFDFPTEEDLCKTVNSGETQSHAEMGQNFPNPLNTFTSIPFSLKNADSILLEILAADGTIIFTHNFGYLPEGEHIFSWNRKNSGGFHVPSGLYFYSIRNKSGAFVMKKMIVVE